MKLTIHRGTKEIGGTCVEIKTNTTRILVDFGMPLVDKHGNQFDQSVFKDKTTSELLEKNLLPDIKGVYNTDIPSVDGILISHPHIDHYGMINFVHKDIPVFMTMSTSRLINIANKLNQVQCTIANKKTIIPCCDLNIGDINIKFYLVDHSGFGSLAFLIESDNKRIFYTGDFRMHGRTAYRTQNLMDNPPVDIDYLIMEGSNIGRKDGKFASEFEVENEIFKTLSSQEDIYFVSCSSQNIDRIVSIYRACLAANKIFVIDPYTARVLHSLQVFRCTIPQHNWGDNIRIYFVPNGYTKAMEEDGSLYMYKESKIEIEEILEKRNQIVLTPIIHKFTKMTNFA